MSKHTPGPWVVGVSSDNGIHCVDAASPDGHPLPTEICEVWGTEHDKTESEESRANARLIAAAPELLAALEALVLFTKPTKSNAVALNNAHNIVAKARGEV